MQIKPLKVTTSSGIFDLSSQIPQRDGAQTGELENYLILSFFPTTGSRIDHWLQIL